MDVDTTLCLCTEYATGGSLYNFLYDSDVTYDLNTAKRFGLEVANGMRYLEQQSILHRGSYVDYLLMVHLKKFNCRFKVAQYIAHRAQ